MTIFFFCFRLAADPGHREAPAFLFENTADTRESAVPHLYKTQSILIYTRDELAFPNRNRPAPAAAIGFAFPANAPGERRRRMDRQGGAFLCLTGRAHVA